MLANSDLLFQKQLFNQYKQNQQFWILLSFPTDYTTEELRLSRASTSVIFAHSKNPCMQWSTQSKLSDQEYATYTIIIFGMWWWNMKEEKDQW